MTAPGINPEHTKQPDTPELECLRAVEALLDLGGEEVIARREVETVALWESLIRDKAPPDMTTSVEWASRPTPDDADFMPQGEDVVMSTGLSFTHSDHKVKIGIDLDFSITEDGLGIFEKRIEQQPDGTTGPKFIRRLNESQVRALTVDLVNIRQYLNDVDLERLILGPLSEPEQPDGARRFHFSDILDILLGMRVSARGVDGARDLLEYMTGDDGMDSVGTIDSAQECRPLLEQVYGDTLGGFADRLSEDLNERDLLRVLNELSGRLGDPMLAVPKLPPGQHAKIDLGTRLELDFPDVAKRVLGIDPATGEDRKGIGPQA